LLFAPLIFMLIVWASFLPVFNIQKIEISGPKELKIEIFNLAYDFLNKQNSKIFSNNNIFLFDTQGMEAEALRLYPRLANISADYSLKDTQKLNVKYEIREPKYIFCDDKNENNACYYLDANGFVFQKVNNLTKNSLLKLHLALDTSYKYFIQKEYPLRGLVPTKNLLQAKSIQKVFDDLKIKLTDLYFKKDGNIIAKSDKFFVKLFDNELLDKQLDNLQFVIKNQLNDKLNNIEYVDVRFKGRAYFKEILPETEKETE